MGSTRPPIQGSDNHDVPGHTPGYNYGDPWHAHDGHRMQSWTTGDGAGRRLDSSIMHTAAFFLTGLEPHERSTGNQIDTNPIPGALRNLQLIQAPDEDSKACARAHFPWLCAIAEKLNEGSHVAIGYSCRRKVRPSGEFLQGKHNFCLCCCARAIYVFVLLRCSENSPDGRTFRRHEYSDGPPEGKGTWQQAYALWSA